MALIQWSLILLLVLLGSESTLSSESIIQMRPPEIVTTLRGISVGRRRGVDLFCQSWRFTVETNNAGRWTQVPEKCVGYVEGYITGELYLSDSNAVADNSVKYARAAGVSGDGKDAWVFDVDDTLLSNVPYYAAHGYGSEIYNETAFDIWVDLAKAPALLPSLRLYKELHKLGFTIFLLTGRTEARRDATETNLLSVGYSNWERLILRGDSDKGKAASVFKSEKRKEIEDEGYIIHGNSGDQWSDLTGYAVAKRSFKLPNPMYYIP